MMASLRSNGSGDGEHNNKSERLDLLGIVNPLSLISKVGTLVTKPIVRIGEIFTIQEEHPDDSGEEEAEAAAQEAREAELLRMSLEGTLYHRKGRSKKWKRRLVLLKFEHGGSFECYKVNKVSTKENHKQLLNNVYSQLHRSTSVGSTIHQMESKTLMLLLSRDTPWMVRDIENDASTFVIEIPSDDANIVHDLIYQNDHEDDDDYEVPTDSFDISEEDEEPGAMYSVPLASSPSSQNRRSGRSNASVLTEPARQKLEKDFQSAHKKQVPLRLYFKCPRKGNEKALWLRGFAKVGRLSPDSWNKRKFFGKIAQIGAATSRLRKDVFAEFTRDARHLEMGGSDLLMSPQYRGGGGGQDNTRALTSAPGEQVDQREFRVHPGWCYPHVWMTNPELREECNLPSTQFHDLRLDSQRGLEIGTLRVEVLQCMGLPRIERSGVSDAVVYLVCGSYAFATDVIPNNSDPYWLRKSRRACIFPIFHGYARMFVGVFDDIRGPKDDLVGRVVLDLSKLRPNSKYDVTLPLRPSAQVYSRKQRGVIRLRFQLDWNNAPKALTSYLPRTLKIPKKTFPNTETTVMCTDPAAFRNIALTVHGSHLPGKFSFNNFRAAIKEVTFSRKMAVLTLKTTMRETRTYVNPAISTFVFCAWMHCVWEDSFGLFPAYFTTFILIHLFRNYARYGIDGPASRGFVPPSWEEMFLAALFGKSIQPLNMIPRGDRIKSPLDDKDDSNEILNPPVIHKIETHKPMGKSLFQAVGFLEDEAVLDHMSPDDRHLEFPFARGEVYPKHSVRNAMATSAAVAKKATDSSRAAMNRSNHGSMNRSNHGGDYRKGRNKHDDMMSVSAHGGYGDTQRSRLYSIGDDDFPASVGGDDAFSMHESELGGVEDLPDFDFDPALPMNPDQDIDFQSNSKGDKNMADDLNEIKHNMHRLTWHLFNEQTHVIRHPEASYFGYGKRVTKRKNVNRDLQKLLGVGYYSSSNYLMAKVAVYVAPIIDSSASFLGVFRAVFNIFTWRDSYFSFWVSFFGIIAAGILFVFPWRLFMFVVGVIVVGPQNLIIRWIRERRGKIPPKVPEPEELSRDLPTGQPLFKSHPPPDAKHRDLDRDVLDPREVHHVVVPYSPWSNVSNRFSDWPPPDNEYCCVRHKPSQAVVSSRPSWCTPAAADSSLHGQQQLPLGVPHYITTAEMSSPRRRRSFTSDKMDYSPSRGAAKRRTSIDYNNNNTGFLSSKKTELEEEPNLEASYTQIKYSRGKVEALDEMDRLTTPIASQSSFRGGGGKIKYRSE